MRILYVIFIFAILSCCLCARSRKRYYWGSSCQNQHNTECREIATKSEGGKYFDLIYDICIQMKCDDAKYMVCNLAMKVSGVSDWWGRHNICDEIMNQLANPQLHLYLLHGFRVHAKLS
eukprot:TRINITY_DN106830_c1_g1_i1.p4 TRINITY_DN106830_c1_g1~~TRINITY_DN106830_c1_g1_i1.p4  ORF type:complete len:119 (-),score=1.18 TRINITY_DN106830_c1_g1_i1:395-751(-)